MKSQGIVGIRDKLIEMQSQGQEVFRFESGGPSHRIPDCVEMAMHQALRDGKTGYTPSSGNPRLLDLIVEKLGYENGITGITSDNILVTPGAMNGLYIAYQAIAATTEFDRNHVACMLPAWTETTYNAELAGLKPVDLLSDNCRWGCISVNSPNNPPGDVNKMSESEWFLGMSEERDIPLISDEAYEHILFDGTKHVSPASLVGSDRTISIFTASKSYSMAGLRIGYIVCKDEELMQHMRTYLRCTANGVSSIAQHGFEAALAPCNDSEMTEYLSMIANSYRQRRDVLYKAVQNCSVLDCKLPSAGFYLWCKLTGKWEGLDTWEATENLLKLGIGSAPGAVFSDDKHIRLAFSCSDEMIVNGAEVLSEL